MEPPSCSTSTDPAADLTRRWKSAGGSLAGRAVYSLALTR